MTSPDITSPSDAAALRPEVSAEEVNALLGDAAPATAVVPFTLGAPEKPSAGRLPGLDRLNERWVKELGAELANRLRRPLEAVVRPVELMPYADWQASVAPPCSLTVCAVAQWSRSMLVAVDGELLFVLVDGYFGGAGGSAASRAQAGLSRAERRLAQLVVDACVRLFRTALEPLAVVDLAPKVAEENPQYVTIARAAETVAVTRIELNLNGRGGTVSLVVPHAAIEALHERLVEGPRLQAEPPARGWRGALATQLEGAEIELASVLVETEISVRELLRLQPGDILPVELPGTATLYAGAEPLLEGRFGISGGTHAVCVTAAVHGAARREKKAASR